MDGVHYGPKGVPPDDTPKVHFCIEEKKRTFGMSRISESGDLQIPEISRISGSGISGSQGSRDSWGPEVCSVLVRCCQLYSSRTLPFCIMVRHVRLEIHHVHPLHSMRILSIQYYSTVSI